ncbi:hypothetical protein FACS1894130_05420 [Spirochaetia bacterium]|nr:hypothetical protein FACS1894130_05420 [Spirochaetia bacterium]
MTIPRVYLETHTLTMFPISTFKQPTSCVLGHFGEGHWPAPESSTQPPKLPLDNL